MEEGYSRAKINRPIALRLTISTFSTRSGFDRAVPCHLIGHRFPDARPKVAVFALTCRIISSTVPRARRLRTVLN
jgi:hypothetical protein